MSGCRKPGQPTNHRTATTHRQTPRSTHRCTQPFNLSTLSGGLVLLCGGDWEPFLGLPFSAGCAAGWYHCCLVALPLPGWQLSWLSRSRCLSVVHGQVSVLFMTSLGTSATTVLNSLQPPAPQSPSAASLCLLFATSGTALTSSSAPIAPSVLVP